MDLYRSRRRLSIAKAIDEQTEEQIGVQEKRFRLFGVMRITEILACFMVCVPVLLVIMVIFGHESYDQGNGFAKASRIIQIKPNVTSTLQRDQNLKGKNICLKLFFSFFYLFGICFLKKSFITFCRFVSPWRTTCTWFQERDMLE